MAESTPPGRGPGPLATREGSGPLATREGSGSLTTREGSGSLTAGESSGSLTAGEDSALADALATVGDRWTLTVVAALLEGPQRFGDLQQAIPGIAPNVLTQRLRQLERNALVITRPYSERPPRFVYELSASGQELAGVLRLLAGWGARHSDAATAPRHAVCGTPMEARWWCPTCEQPVDDVGADELHFA